MRYGPSFTPFLFSCLLPHPPLYSGVPEILLSLLKKWLVCAGSDDSDIGSAMEPSRVLTHGGNVFLSTFCRTLHGHRNTMPNQGTGERKRGQRGVYKYLSEFVS